MSQNVHLMVSGLLGRETFCTYCVVGAISLILSHVIWVRGYRCSIHHPSILFRIFCSGFSRLLFVCSSAHPGPGSCSSLPLQNRPGCRGFREGQTEGFSAHRSAKVCSMCARQLLNHIVFLLYLGALNNVHCITTSLHGTWVIHQE